MKPARLLLLPLLLSAASAHGADKVTEHLLDTKDSGDGSWPCLFYELNYNNDITVAQGGKWYAVDEDESYWREGFGPFSSERDNFLVTHWQSTVHPILIRRHFNLTAADIDKIEAGTVTLTYSYDENPTFWLNGTRLTASTGWNDSNYATFRLSGTRKQLLHEGDNLLCVSLKQGAGSGHIDFGMTVTYDPSATGIPSVIDNDEEGDGTAYNLLGQPIADPQASHGIIVTRGKKILKK